MGFTRVPVFLETDKSKMGILFVKDLIGIIVNGKLRLIELYIPAVFPYPLSV
jgi:CBS domain containing-hemolysin-like protein